MVKNRSKPATPGVQYSNRTGQTERPNRTKGAAKQDNSGHVPVAQNDSLSAGEAARELGISVRTLRRLCSIEGLPSFKTPGGQIRVRRNDVDAYRQGAVTQTAPIAGVSSGIVESKRESVQALNLEVQERRVKRELKRFDDEDAETERRRETSDRIVLEQLRLQRERESQLREQEQQRAAAARQRRQWVDGWMQFALQSIPQDAPQDVALDVRQAVEETLEDLVPTQPQSVVQRLVLAAVERGLKPWRRRQEIERAFREARKQLPALARSIIPEMGSELTEWETRATQAARQAISCLSADASFEEIRAAAVEAGRRIAADYQAEQDRAQAERARQQRESTKKFLIDFGARDVFFYLQKLRLDGELWDEDLERKTELEQAVRSKLEGTLAGTEGFEAVQRMARAVVDSELEEEV